MYLVPQAWRSARSEPLRRVWEWLLDGPGMRVSNGAVVHFGNPDRLDCMILYGETWRAAASAGRVALRLRKPQP